jgi:hypothetical protein
MLLRFALSAIVLALTGLAADAADLPSPTKAADLPSQTKLGAIFADPSLDRRAAPRSDDRSIWAILLNRPEEANSPQVPGYYGQAGDFYYETYYGTPSKVIFGRLPYRCGYYGLC